MAEEQESEVNELEKSKKKPWGKIMLMLAIIATIGAFAGGLFAGPQLGNKLKLPGYEPQKTIVRYEEPPPALTKKLDPFIVDIKDAEGDLHHIKVGIAVELKAEVKEEEFDKYIPRARDTALGFLRTLEFSKVTDPNEFDVIREELGKRVTDAVGEARANKVLFTDFVVQ